MFKKFEDIAVGDSHDLVKTITEADVRKFVDMTGDDNPLHVDRHYAEQTPFKDVVVHGMLGASFISTVIGTKLPGKGALWVSQTMEFLCPVRLGDELTITCRVLRKIDRDCLLELETTIVNQNQQHVLSGKGMVKMLPEPKESVSRTDHMPSPLVAMVTGGAGGIGKAISLRLAQAGFHVIINYLRQSGRAEEIVNQIVEAGWPTALAVQADISTEGGVETLYQAAIRKFGHVDVLINNASPAIIPKALNMLQWEDIQKQSDVQVKGAFLMTQRCVPEMQAQHWGRIINISSQAVEGSPTVGWTAYAMAKGALSIFSRQMAAELAPSGITVNGIAPGMCETPLIGDISEKNQQIVARQTPTRRLAQPEDIAALVAFLVSNEAGHINGQNLAVNGGMVMR